MSKTFDRSNVGSLFDTVLRDTLNETAAALVLAQERNVALMRVLRELVTQINDNGHAYIWLEWTREFRAARALLATADADAGGA